jgi:catechol 2,3-dioxygenase-like lactoylglutathione lyase family enzyme
MSAFDIPRRGTSHHGLATRDMDGTIAFYEGVLGFPLVFVNYEPEGSRRKAGLRHAFFDIGNDEMFTFMEEEPWEGPGPDPLASVSQMNHYAFNAGNDSCLEARRQSLLAQGIKVTDICKVGVTYPDGSQADTAHSIYFRDPVNDLLLEFCVFVRNFVEADLRQEPNFSDHHGTPVFLEAFLGPKRYAEMMAARAAEPVNAVASRPRHLRERRVRHRGCRPAAGRAGRDRGLRPDARHDLGVPGDVRLR